eukprot:7457115-Pyramimonas_sp.AAC.1
MAPRGLHLGLARGPCGPRVPFGPVGPPSPFCRRDHRVDPEGMQGIVVSGGALLRYQFEVTRPCHHWNRCVVEFRPPAGHLGRLGPAQWSPPCVARQMGLRGCGRRSCKGFAV